MKLRTLQLTTSWGELTVSGATRAGDGTVVLVPQLRLSLDTGRPHHALPPMATVVVSHGHMDHIGGLGYWASQRFLNAMGTGTIVVPEDIIDDVGALLELYAHLEGGRPYDVRLVAAGQDTVHPLRPDMELRFFRTDHWVPTLGSELVWRKSRLRSDLVGLDEHEIAALRQAGEEVSERQEVSLLAYCADSGPGLLQQRPHVLVTEVLLVECSFFKPADRHRAERFGHMHLDDLVAVAPNLGCRHLVLLHGSRRHRLREIEEFLDDQLRPHLSCSMHHLMVDWD